MRGSALGRKLLGLSLVAGSALVAPSLATRPAHALGVLVSQQGEASVVASRTLIAKISPTLTRQTTEISFRLDPRSDFLWLLPIPADADADAVTISTCDDVNFEELAAIAEPRVLLRSRESGDCGEREIPTPYETEIGVVDYGIGRVASDNVTAHVPFLRMDELQEWIGAVGTPDAYVLPMTGPAWGVVSYYVEHTYSFVAAEVVPVVTTGTVCVQVEYTPVAEREFDHLLPFKSLSAANEPAIEVLLYSIDDGRTVPFADPETGDAVYLTATINQDEIRATSATTTDYDEVFWRTIGVPPDPPVFVIESSGALAAPLGWTGSESTYLTRLRTIASPSQMSGPDLALQVEDLDESEPVSKDYSIIVARAGGRPDATLALCAVALVGTLAFRRRRRTGRDR